MADQTTLAHAEALARRAFEGFAAQDAEAIAACFHPDGELVIDGDLAGLTGKHHAGRSGVRAWFEDWFGVMEPSEARIEHLASVGDRVLVVAYQRSRSATAGAPAATRFGVVCSFHEELIGRFELYPEHHAARKALGLHRWPWDDHTVHPAPFDSAEAEALRRELARDLEERYGGDSEPGAKPTGEDVVVFLVARNAGGDPVGCGTLLDLGGGVAEIKRMYVRPEARGQGVSRGVLEGLEREALRRGFARCRLETGERQPEAMGLYRSAGYEEIEKFGPYRDSPLSRCFERRLR